ncbi:hypothetical protein ACFY2M_38040 [Streptomyces sp. NPDC001276]|uniref:hypothetical protein n=1 Tax=Streptomyces sp. NPDC001276 TaxID=3364555 RepID=UPI0036A81544
MFAAAGIPLRFVGLLVLAEPWMMFVPLSLVEIQAALFVPVLVMLLMSSALTRAQRQRFRVRLGVRIPALPAERRRSPRAVVAWLRSSATWPQVGYHVVADSFWPPGSRPCGYAATLRGAGRPRGSLSGLWWNLRLRARTSQ